MQWLEEKNIHVELIHSSWSQEKGFKIPILIEPTLLKSKQGEGDI